MATQRLPSNMRLICLKGPTCGWEASRQQRALASTVRREGHNRQQQAEAQQGGRAARGAGAGARHPRQSAGSHCTCLYCNDDSPGRVCCRRARGEGVKWGGGGGKASRIMSREGQGKDASQRGKLKGPQSRPQCATRTAVLACLHRLMMLPRA